MTIVTIGEKERGDDQEPGKRGEIGSKQSNTRLSKQFADLSVARILSLLVEVIYCLS